MSCYTARLREPGLSLLVVEWGGGHYRTRDHDSKLMNFTRHRCLP